MLLLVCVVVGAVVATALSPAVVVVVVVAVVVAVARCFVVEVPLRHSATVPQLSPPHSCSLAQTFASRRTRQQRCVKVSYCIQWLSRQQHPDWFWARGEHPSFVFVVVVVVAVEVTLSVVVFELMVVVVVATPLEQKVKSPYLGRVGSRMLFKLQGVACVRLYSNDKHSAVRSHLAAHSAAEAAGRPPGSPVPQPGRSPS